MSEFSPREQARNSITRRQRVSRALQRGFFATLLVGGTAFAYAEADHNVAAEVGIGAAEVAIIGASIFEKTAATRRSTAIIADYATSLNVEYPRGKLGLSIGDDREGSRRMTYPLEATLSYIAPLVVALAPGAIETTVLKAPAATVCDAAFALLLYAYTAERERPTILSRPYAEHLSCVEQIAANHAR
jgi:hypothetical protein